MENVLNFFKINDTILRIEDKKSAKLIRKVINCCN